MMANVPTEGVMKYEAPINGNSRRKHKQNVKRKRLRKIKNNSKKNNR